MDKSEYYIAVYTNRVKDYAAEDFFKHFDQFDNGGVVDNSAQPGYDDRLRELTKLPVYHLDIPYEPKLSLFQRNVAESVEFLRKKFLETDCKYFLILESDVIVPDLSFLENLDKTVHLMNANNSPNPWGAIGCIYYQGFHDYKKTGIQLTNHVLSGATVYKREALEKYAFRWDENNLGGFPDAWWSIDAGGEYSLWNDHNIVLEHKHASNGGRGQEKL